jgi:hypothetical protein
MEAAFFVSLHHCSSCWLLFFFPTLLRSKAQTHTMAGKAWAALVVALVGCAVVQGRQPWTP